MESVPDKRVRRFTTPSWRSRAGWVLVVLLLVAVIIGLLLAGHTPLACVVAIALLVALAAGPGRLFGDRPRGR